ncbi:hypothetical protein [Nitratidesulfovibrio sp. 1201_IL3209]|uniref:hypothetical protein n=1 Tax=Nitratidesulfovibrio sp. 1201_IL3209 TaxID=3084053 RepID=UPI002FD942FE
MFFSKFFSGSRNEPEAPTRDANASTDAPSAAPGADAGSGQAPGNGGETPESPGQSPGQSPDQPHEPGRFGGLGDLLGEQERKYVLAYIVIGIVLVEFLVAIVAIWQGVANVQSMPDGTVRFRFPWGGYLVSVAAAPVVVLLVLQVIALGYTRLIKGDPVLTEAQLRQLPPWLQKMLAAVNGVPTFLLMLGVTLLAVVIYYFDRVLGFVIRLGESTEHLVLWVGGGVLAAWCVGYLGRMWFAYKVRRMQEEYAYRREVLDRTGMIIVDQRSMLAQLPGHVDPMTPRALPGTIDVSPSGGMQAPRVLPPAPPAPSAHVTEAQDAPPVSPAPPATPMVVDAPAGDAGATHVVEVYDATAPDSASEPEGEVIEPGLHEPSSRKPVPQPIPQKPAPAPKKPRTRKKAPE